MKKIVTILVAILIILFAGAFYFLRQNQAPEQRVLKNTLEISKEYISLRYQTDDVLTNAKEYSDYDAWNNDMTDIIKEWGELEKESKNLEKMAKEMAQEKLSFNFTSQVMAYTKDEISNVFDKAPAGKKIATLAKYLGVDAKRAQLILNQDQAQVTADAWNQAGDTFQTLETSALVIKDGCKVAGFAGGIVLTGGAAGLATAGTLTTTTVVVAGVDLALEVTEDGAQIAFGGKNKVSSFVKDVRTVTEPIANVLTITNIPSNLGNAFGKFDSVMVGLEQFREAAQEGKVVGVDLTNFEYQKPFQRIRQAKYPGTVTVAEMEKAEVEDWLKSLNKEYQPMTQEEAKDFFSNLSEETKQEKIVEEKEVTKEPIKEENDSNKTDIETKSPKVEQPEKTTKSIRMVKGMAGTYSGSATLQHVEEDVEADDSLAVTLQLNESGTGTANVYGFDGDAYYAGNTVGFSVTMKEKGAAVKCVFKGKATRNGNQTTISGDMPCSMMGVTFASYSWSAQK